MKTSEIKLCLFSAAHIEQRGCWEGSDDVTVSLVLMLQIVMDYSRGGGGRSLFKVKAPGLTENGRRVESRS